MGVTVLGTDIPIGVLTRTDANHHKTRRAIKQRGTHLGAQTGDQRGDAR